MKKLVYTLAFAVLGFTASYAQKAEKTKFTPEERAEKAATVLQQKLSLNDEQKAKIKQIELDRFKQHDEFRKKDAADMQARIAQRKSESKAHQERISAVLTKEQQKTLAAAREEMRIKMKDRAKEHRKFKRAPKTEEGK